MVVGPMSPPKPTWYGRTRTALDRGLPRLLESPTLDRESIMSLLTDSIVKRTKG